VGNTAKKVADKGLLLRDTTSEIAARRAAIWWCVDPAGCGLVPQTGMDVANVDWRNSVNTESVNGEHGIQ
jgi:hypothetical protein